MDRNAAGATRRWSDDVERERRRPWTHRPIPAALLSPWRRRLPTPSSPVRRDALLGRRRGARSSASGFVHGGGDVQGIDSGALDDGAGVGAEVGGDLLKSWRRRSLGGSSPDLAGGQRSLLQLTPSSFVSDQGLRFFSNYFGTPVL
nr:uncharacterized protein LOC127346056 isoform X2 [Lolium perenne]